MTPNHYATLGLSPASEDVVIRAAYLALMRRYHPDRNPSAEAAARTRSIAAAYAVLGDPEKRADYDYARLAEAEPVDSPEPGRPIIPGGAFAAASMSLLLAVVFLMAWLPLRLAEPQASRASIPERAAAPAPGFAAEPASIAELDRRSAAGAAALDPEAAAEPRLPPGPQAPAPSVRLAEAQPPPAAETPAAASPRTRPAVLASAARPSAPQPAVGRTATSAPKPSFSCQVARTRSEIAVCRNVQLANLDRQQALLYSQSWGRADSAKRAELLRTRERFVAQRDNCRSDACTSSAYLKRMREVSEIMTGGSTQAR